MLLGFIVLFSGCAANKPNLQRLTPLPAGKICRVAVLPFIDNSEFDQGGLVVTRVFTAEFARRGNYMVLPEGDVRNVYRHLRIPPGKMPDVEQIQILGNQMEAQLIVVGNIYDMEERTTDGYTANPVLALNLQLLDPKSGNIIWTTYHRREGAQYRTFMHFGLINTISELARRVSQEILEQWFSAGGLKPCSE